MEGVEAAERPSVDEVEVVGRAAAACAAARAGGLEAADPRFVEVDLAGVFADTVGVPLEQGHGGVVVCAPVVEEVLEHLGAEVDRGDVDPLREVGGAFEAAGVAGGAARELVGRVDPGEGAAAADLEVAVAEAEVDGAAALVAAAGVEFGELGEFVGVGEAGVGGAGLLEVVVVVGRVEVLVAGVLGRGAELLGCEELRRVVRRGGRRGQKSGSSSSFGSSKSDSMMPSSRVRTGSSAGSSHRWTGAGRLRVATARATVSVVGVMQ